MVGDFSEDEANESGKLPTWERAHAELLRLSAERARLEVEEGRWLVRALGAGTHVRLGYASFGEYVERLFGYSPRWTGEKIRVAKALEELPELARALDRGAIAWSISRELTRVATPATEAEWLSAVRGRTARDVERMVSGHRLGSRPSDPIDEAARRHALRFDVTGETLAIFREALAKLRRESTDALDDDAALLLMSRYVLGGTQDEGRSSYQVAVTVCESCGNGRAQGCGELVHVGREVVEMAECDGQRVALDLDSASDTHVGQTFGRAKQSIPPAVRRHVMRRDTGRCRVPGCRHAAFVDVHHIERRVDGGSNDPDNLIVLCGAHHRAAHRGELLVEGRVSRELVFRHADGTEYGSVAVSPPAADVRTKAFRALTSLGLRETESRRAVERAVTHVGSEARLERLVRRALAELTEPRVAA